jgi:hypothetical protein
MNPYLRAAAKFPAIRAQSLERRNQRRLKRGQGGGQGQGQGGGQGQGQPPRGKP